MTNQYKSYCQLLLFVIIGLCYNCGEVLGNPCPIDEGIPLVATGPACSSTMGNNILYIGEGVRNETKTTGTENAKTGQSSL